MTCVTGEREISLYPSWKPMRLPEVEDVTDAPFLVHLCFHSQFPDKPLPMGSNIVPYTGSLQGLPQFGLPRSLPHYPLGFFKNVLLRCSWAVNSVTPRGVVPGNAKTGDFCRAKRANAQRIPNSLWQQAKIQGMSLSLGPRNYGPIVHIALVSRDWLVQRAWNEQGIFGEYQAMPVPDHGNIA